MPDVVGFAAGLAALCGIGFGASLWLLPINDRRVALALAISPAMGLVMVGLVERLLVVWVGPVRLWAVPATIVLLVASLAAAIQHWRKRPDEFLFLLKRRQVWLTLLTAAILSVSCAALAAPMAAKGIQYTIFRSNSSDALVYMSLAESLRTVAWQTLLRGSAFTPANLQNLAALAGVSPTSLFTARFISPSSVLNYPALIAWGAEITGIPVYRYYYIMALVCFASALPVGWAIGFELRLPRLVWWLAGPTIALGFWARFVLERDAGYQIGSIPALLLLVFAWIQLEAEPPRWISPARVLLALAIAAVLFLHTPVALVVGVAFAIYYGLGLLQREVTAQAILYHGVTAGLVLAALIVSGQLLAVVVTSTSISTVLTSLLTIEAEVIVLLRQDPISAFWGLPRPWLVWPLAGIVQQVARRLALLSGLAWFAALGVTIAAVALNRASRAVRIVLSIATAGLVVLAIMWAFGNFRAADKALTYVYPYLLLSAAGAAIYAQTFRRIWLRAVATLAIALLLLSQLMLGAYLPFYEQAGGLFAASSGSKPEGYDLSPIRGYLDQHPPRLLLVNIPREKSWEFSLYSMFVFEQYPAHFLSGLVVDNNKTYRSLWFDTLQAPPDYAVTLRAVDYIAAAHLGTVVAQTRDLILYHLDRDDLALHQAQEALDQQQESVKPLFPSLAH
jgi:hypothetical protein